MVGPAGGGPAALGGAGAMPVLLLPLLLLWLVLIFCFAAAAAALPLWLEFHRRWSLRWPSLAVL